jgi:hypothetical protein
LVAAALALVCGASRAQNIVVESAALVPHESGFALNAQFAVYLAPPLRDALNRGIPLPFVVDFEVTRPRRFWFGEDVISVEHAITLSYAPLTRQFRVAEEGSFHHADTLDDALKVLGRVRDAVVATRGDLRKGVQYEAATRMRLDPNQLPAAAQASALTSRDWVMKSDWYRWKVVP